MPPFQIDYNESISFILHTDSMGTILMYKIMNMFQYLRDERREINPKLSDTRYADTAIDEMLKKMEAHGAKKEFIEAKIIGGANMFSAFKSDISENNISYAKEKLKKAGVKLVGECIGGSQGRSVEFSVASGIVTVKTKF